MAGDMIKRNVKKLASWVYISEASQAKIVYCN